MQKMPLLLPNPLFIRYTEGVCELRDKNFILLPAKQAQSILFSGLQLKAAILACTQKEFNIIAGVSGSQDQVGISLQLDPELNIEPQGYRIVISPERITIQGKDEPGLFYACYTLSQLFQYYSSPPGNSGEIRNHTLPCLEISDWPDYSNRGVMIDVSRDKVPTMETLFELVNLLASWKINQIQLYTEHTFAYRQYPEVWSGASPFTGEEILKLDAYCHERYIELVPNQNSFSHLEKWLKLPRFTGLAEAPDGFDFPWGHHSGPFSLCPLEQGSITLLRSLYDELLPHFSSRQFNVGCDETFDLGQGRSKTECERVGKGRVYLDFLLKIYNEVSKRGFRMQFWGDIIMEHPELVQDLPKDTIALEWGYEASHPFEEHGEKLANASLPFYVCPGTSSWNSIAGRTDNCLLNLANAAQNGRKYGADGYLITDWGDNGHWQTLPVSYVGFAAGAAFSWCYQSNQDLDVRQAINRYVFNDRSGNMGNLAYEVGNLYRAVGIEPPNSSALFYILQKPIQEFTNYLDAEAGIQALTRTLEMVDQVASYLSSTNSLRADNNLLKDEFNLTIALLRHACKRGIFGFGSSEYTKALLLEDLESIMADYQQIWLLRNRPGGLSDSLSYFETTKKDYQ
ncbi:MAG: family 20 glycosylhydrolase [Anaerolineales bacterium]